MILINSGILEFLYNYYIPLLCTLIIMILGHLYIQNETRHLPKLNIDSICQTCQTGDIILFRWYYIDIGFRLFTKYCHVGIIFRNKQGDTYLLETHPDETQESNEILNNVNKTNGKLSSKLPNKNNIKRGVNIYPLKTRLEEYDGYCYFLQLDKRIRDHTNNSVLNKKKLKLYKTIPFDDNFRYTFLQSWFYNKLGWEMPSKSKLYCSEFIGLVLKDIGVLEPHFNIHILSPSSFESLKRNNITLYTNIHQITF